jgi:hypothetical protein
MPGSAGADGLGGVGRGVAGFCEAKQGFIMTLPALYQLATEYRQSIEKLSELDLDEVTVRDTLDSLGGDLETKATNVAMFSRNLEALASSIKQAEEQMHSRRKALENRSARLKKYLLDCMEYAGISKVDSPYFAISIKNNPPKVIIDEVDFIPAEYMRHPPPPPPEPDKTLLAKFLKDGVEIPGCHLVQERRIDIK